ncbi:MAG: hypothetical protein NTZ45_04280 [Methylococcales bacterium]|nr:hypothetical protein [Methylococcales bacterium]
MTVYKPLDLIAEAASKATNQEFVTVAEALNIAANNTVLTLKIKDSASEIARHFDALINIQRAGKLLDVSVNDPVDGQYVLPFPKLSTTNQNLLASQVINLTHWNASTSDIAKKFANSNVTSINVIDSLANIQKNIDILQADNSKIHTVSFTNDDTQNVLSLTYDQYANDVDVLAKISSPHSIVVTSGKSTNSSNFYKAGNSMESLNYYGILKNLDVDHNNVTLKYNAAKNEVITLTHFNSGDSVQFTGADNKIISIAQLHFYNTSVDNQFGVLISTAPSNQNTFNGVFIAGLTLSMLNKNATDDIIFDDNTLDNINLESYLNAPPKALLLDSNVLTGMVKTDALVTVFLDNNSDGQFTSADQLEGTTLADKDGHFSVPLLSFATDLAGNQSPVTLVGLASQG